MRTLFVDVSNTLFHLHRWYEHEGSVNTAYDDGTDTVFRNGRRGITRNKAQLGERLKLSGKVAYGSMLIKIQLDATVCRYLFTAKSLYMFRVSQHPSLGVLKTVTATSGTVHNTGTATSLQRGPIGQ